jgi:hypothetical protein
MRMGKDRTERNGTEQNRSEQIRTDQNRREALSYCYVSVNLNYAESCRCSVFQDPRCAQDFVLNGISFEQ